MQPLLRNLNVIKGSDLNAYLPSVPFCKACSNHFTIGLSLTKMVQFAISIKLMQSIVIVTND